MELRNFQSLQEAYLEVYGEAYKELPVDKMLRQSVKKHAAFIKSAGLSRKQIDSSGNVFRTPRRLSPKRKSTKEVERNLNKISAIANTHNPDEAKAKSEANKKRGEERRTQREQVDIYDLILSHLLDEGYAETPEAAEVMMVNMSEEWRESIMEGYKKLPVGKMMRKVEYRAEREADTRADREREANDPNSILGYDRAREAYEKAEKNKDRSNRMIDVADTHSKKLAKAKSKYKN